MQTAGPYTAGLYSWDELRSCTAIGTYISHVLTDIGYKASRIEPSTYIHVRTHMYAVAVMVVSLTCAS